MKTRVIVSLCCGLCMAACNQLQPHRWEKVVEVTPRRPERPVPVGERPTTAGETKRPTAEAETKRPTAVGEAPRPTPKPSPKSEPRSVSRQPESSKTAKATRGEAPASPQATPGSTTATPAPEQKKTEYPFASPVPGKPGFVTSPYAPYAGQVDVQGFAPGSEARDPFSGKIFRVP